MLLQTLQQQGKRDRIDLPTTRSGLKKIKKEAEFFELPGLEGIVQKALLELVF